MSSERRLMIAIIQDSDSEKVLAALIQANFRVTRIASSGGFLRRGNDTLLIGTDSDYVEEAKKIIRENSAPAIDPGLKRASVFVLKVDRFEQI
ncbi:MAG: cyclic-di-AMP receptor [Anaerolineales bacterium]